MYGIAAAAGTEATVIRVGFFAFEGYHEQDANGIRSGYGYEMLQHLAGYANFRYEYVGYGKSWREMHDMLANGEIDILTSAQKTPEREARFLFSTDNIGVSAAMLTVKAGDTRYLLADYANWNGMRVGMLKGSSRNASFAKYAKQKGFTWHPVYFDNIQQMLAELASSNPDKTIDAMLTSNLRRIEGESVLTRFDASPFYIMVRKDRPELLDRINKAIVRLDMCEPGLRARLMRKFYSPASGAEIALTPEERAYIKRMRGTTLTALINPDRPPYSWRKNGKMTGILYDVALQIIARSGLDIKFVDVEDREQYWRRLQNGGVDIRFDMVHSYNQAEKDGYWLTVPYVTVPVSRVYRKDTTEFRTAAAPMNPDILDNYAHILKQKGLPLTYYDSVEKTLHAVLDKRQDVAFLAQDTATRAVRDDITNTLVAEELFGDSISYSVAVDQAESPLLYTILNKVAASLDEQTANAIRQSYAANLEKPFSVIGYLYDNPLYVLCGVVALLGMLFLLFATVSLYRHKAIEHAHLQKEQAQNELLKEALTAAEKAAAAKGQFLSRVSHEMRTPLNAIIGFMVLAKDADGEKLHDYMASSELAAKQLLNVINDVLDMSSIESGKLKIASAPFNFRHIVSSITNIYGTQCVQKGLKYETKLLTPMDDWLVGDELRVNQILMNLLGNAVKFTIKGHIRLSISQTLEEEDRLFLRFEVSDSGCGMSEEMQTRLFKPFEQEDAGTARKYGGSGLGLSIVKNLVVMMGGTVRVESRAGEGTTFIVDLPFKKYATDALATLPQKVDTLRVLVVDDEPAEHKYIGQVLTRMNIRFHGVHSGREALAALEASERENDLYNVCLVDWRMPDMNGLDTTRAIREQYGKDMTVIVVSAYDFEQAVGEAKAAGANMFVGKPLFQSSLFDLFMKLTDGNIGKPREAQRQSWDFAGRRVLLAEDNVLNQVVAKGYLAKFNVVVELAENGKKAVEMFTASAAGHYDAILMDIQMPELDGFGAAKAIRESAHPEAKTVQIIAQTADAFNEDVARCLSAGMNGHVSKPIKPELLAKALYNAFTTRVS